MVAPPKAILFDIGGVCVVSPLQAIADYEKTHNIPKDWVNFAISRASPNGAWQRIERGEIKLDESFLEAFRADLHNQARWDEYHRVFKHRRRGAKKEQESRSTDSGGIAGSEAKVDEYIPPLPWIDSTSLFWGMMSISRAPDPFMFPALRYLRMQTSFLLGALSNNITFPPDHPFSRPASDPASDIRAQFDVFVASADVGMRKPAREIYELTVQRLDEFDKRRGGSGIGPRDVLFLDDIGQNVKMARSLGMRTIKVVLGETEEAVRSLGREIGIDLLAETRREGGKAKL